MVGSTPTGTVARVSPKLVASTGLVALQLGLEGCAEGLQSGMLMTLRLPAWVPSPWLSTTSSVSTLSRSAQTGWEPTVMVGL